LLSVLVVVLDSVASISKQFHGELVTLEWMFTILFSIEYIARLYCAKYRWRYATSFYGVIDFLAVVPTYLALLFPELHALIDVRVLRLIRMFRIFKLTAYMSEYQHLAEALTASRRKILSFFIGGLDGGDCDGFHHVRSGRAKQWLYEHSDCGVLGNYDDDNSRVW
jgi:voltage-gated potassium channel